tara:strand:- start:133 stop:438 length:306 start_codon:yes stop_codon:yes gene_type:complete
MSPPFKYAPAITYNNACLPSFFRALLSLNASSLTVKSLNIFLTIALYPKHKAVWYMKLLGIPKATLYNSLNALLKYDLIYKHNETFCFTIKGQELFHKLQT